MNIKHKRIWAPIQFVAMILLSPLATQECSGQTTAERPKKVLTPEQVIYQKQYREFVANRQSLQAQGKQVFDAEMAREKAGDCPNAQSNSEFINCFGEQLTIAGGNLTAFEGIIRELQAPGPQMPGQSDSNMHGPAGPPLTPKELGDEFEQVERVWRDYRETACRAAYHQFGGGTGGPSFEGQCELKLTRDHMRELDMIYGGDLHL